MFNVRKTAAGCGRHHDHAPAARKANSGLRFSRPWPSWVPAWSSLIAIGLSLLRHVNHSYRPHSAALSPDANGRWEPAPASPGSETTPGLIVYRFGADLFFANADRFCRRGPGTRRRG